MNAVPELVLPDWVTLPEAAAYLSITPQAAGRVAIRRRFVRCRIGKIILISRAAIERYAETRQPSGPRKPA